VVKNDLSAGKEENAGEVTPKIIAHRGASAFAPENTLAAFDRAIRDGADGIEFDVRLSRDGQAVVIHDRTLKRTAQRKGRVSDLLSEELALLDVGTWFNKANPDRADPSFAEQGVSTLSSALEYLRSFQGTIYIELKCEEDNIRPLTLSVARTLESSPLHSKVIIKSFRLSALMRIRALCPDIRVAALFAPKIKTILRKEKYLVDLACEFGADELSLHYSLVTRKLIKKASARGMPVAIWTTDNPQWIKRAIRLGLNAVITNDPAGMIAKRTEVLDKL
jgi:glycerophosphoryl diester phosphodiesterase